MNFFSVFCFAHLYEMFNNYLYSMTSQAKIIEVDLKYSAQHGNTSHLRALRTAIIEPKTEL